MASFDLVCSATQLVVVDVQERLLPHICEHERVLTQIVRMMRAAPLLGLPITICEQYPQGLGPSAAAIREAGGDAPVLSKMTFSAARDIATMQRVTGLSRPTVLLVGIETHVCVQQTAWDMRERGLQPVLLADAVSSRRPSDHQIALDGLRAAGVCITTFEAALYRLMERAGTDVFKKILPLVK